MLNRVRLLLELFVLLQRRSENLLSACAALLLTIELSCAQAARVDVLGEVALKVRGDSVVDSLAYIELMLRVMDHPMLLARTVLGIVRIGQMILLRSVVHRGLNLIFQIRFLPLFVVPDNAHLKLCLDRRVPL